MSLLTTIWFCIKKKIKSFLQNTYLMLTFSNANSTHSISSWLCATLENNYVAALNTNSKILSLNNKIK